jgi:hypothetical protein
MHTLTKQILFFVAALVAFAGREARAEPVIAGEYFEAMNCDVGMGPSRTPPSRRKTVGDNAILAWAVSQGSWDGVNLEGLIVVTVLDAEGRLNTESEGKVKSVVLVDQRASEEQAKALLSMAAALAPRYFDNILRIEKKKIAYQRVDEDARLEVGDNAQVKIKTTALSTQCETICGNTDKPHPSLSKVAHARCAQTVEASSSGAGRGLGRSDPNKQSAVVGQFEL